MGDLRQDTHWQDDHIRGGGHRHHRGREGQDPGQGGHPPGPAAFDLRWQAARGWEDSPGLQHPEGVHPALGAPLALIFPYALRKLLSISVCQQKCGSSTKVNDASKCCNMLSSATLPYVSCIASKLA